MLAVAALLGMTLILTERRTVALDSAIVRIGDVASDAGTMARMPIARLPRGRREIVLSRRAIGSLIRRAVPGAAVSGDDRLGTVAFVASIGEPRVSTCIVARSSIMAGAVVSSEMVASVPCEGHAADGLIGYDRARGDIVARRTIGAGVNMGPMRMPEPFAVHRGDQLTLISRAGPVIVERAVTAMQSGRDGRRIFVRDGSGQVSSIALAVAAR